ncbi:MAG: dNTP triphosphohydrolase, partial [Alphaproteobacteria bacterium]|nr:dNTP triphosphohydrolase [Alphaproteobacteria bacterium]
QIAEAMARHLGLDRDLTAAVALSHDLGHTCFGHAGEEALDEAMKEFGGFSHNGQTLKILTRLEKKYPKFSGLNLCWETLEGVVKHNGPAQNGVCHTIAVFHQQYDLELSRWTSLEAQLAAIADDIAYNTHDVDDGVRSGLVSLEEIATWPLFQKAVENVQREYSGLDRTRQLHEIVRQTIGALVGDVLATTKDHIQKHRITTADDVRHQQQAMVQFSPNVQADLAQLRQKLMQNLYRHPTIMQSWHNAVKIVQGLFQLYMHDESKLPDDWQLAAQRAASQTQKAELIADYIAGMTDRYAIKAYRQHLGEISV